MGKIGWLIGVGVFCLMGGSGCGDDEASGGSTLSGTLSLSAAPDGVVGYVKLVAPGGDAADPAIYFATSTPFSGGSATYSVSGVANGSYTGWGFIDVNGNAAGDSSSLPDSGDWATPEGGDIVMDGSRVVDITENDWTQL